jgi:hypothetical protein
VPPPTPGRSRVEAQRRAGVEPAALDGPVRLAADPRKGPGAAGPTWPVESPSVSRLRLRHLGGWGPRPCGAGRGGPPDATKPPRPVGVPIPSGGGSVAVATRSMRYMRVTRWCYCSECLLRCPERTSRKPCGESSRPSPPVHPRQMGWIPGARGMGGPRGGLAPSTHAFGLVRSTRAGVGLPGRSTQNHAAASSCEEPGRRRPSGWLHLIFETGDCREV